MTGNSGIDAIGIYTNPDVFEHKRQHIKNGGVGYWWFRNEMGNDIKRLWIAYEGKWRGYFTVRGVFGDEIEFDKWNPRSNMPDRKPFQGFTYNVPDVK